MGRELVVAWVGRQRRDDWDKLCGAYRQRIAHYVPVREIPVRVKGAEEGAARLRVEGRSLTAALPSPAWIVAMDRRGKSMGSEVFSSWLEQRQADWPHALVFLLGSDLGLDPSVKDAANEVISMGRMTLPHELARLVLLEQLYRAFTIRAGIKYHRSAF